MSMEKSALSDGPIRISPSDPTEKSPFLDDSEIDLDQFILWYYVLYEEIRGTPHPKLKPQQKQRVIKELANFLSDPDYAPIPLDGLQAMARDFFDRVDSNDWRINHFATRGILENRFYDIYHHGYEP